MRYLLDTCIISYFIRGDEQIMTHLKNISPNELSISTITQMEIEFGLQLNPLRAKKISTVIYQLLDSIHILSFNQEDARCAATIRAALQHKGTPIGAYDVLLAGCALHRGLILATSNLREFERIIGLQVEDWRKKIIN